MKINLKHIFDIVGEAKDIGYEIPAEDLSDIRGYEFAAPVKVSGRVYNRAGVVYLDYSVSFTLSAACDRCLKEFLREYDFDFRHIVVPSLSNEDNDDFVVAEGESIELNDIAVTDLLLQLPTKMLCKEDCKGLCMVCGCDLNETTCDCLN